jgi:hypothetical protein
VLVVYQRSGRGEVIGPFVDATISHEKVCR